LLLLPSLLLVSSSVLLLTLPSGEERCHLSSRPERDAEESDAICPLARLQELPWALVAPLLKLLRHAWAST
jgi:hypothetical protein